MYPCVFYGTNGHVLACIVSIGYVSVCFGFGFPCSAWGRRSTVTVLVDCDFSMTDTFWNYWPKKSELWWPSGPAIALQTVLVSSKPKIGKCCTCLSPVWIVPVSSFLGLLPLILAGDTGTIPHSMHGRMDTCYLGDECDSVATYGTGNWNGLSLWPSCHSVDWRSKHNSFLQYQQ